MDDLFTTQMRSSAPLADRMRPRTIDEFIGQSHIVGQGKLLRRAIEADRLTSSIFFGPPGCGKTTLAGIIANHTNAAFVRLNAVTSGVSDVREVIKEAEKRLRLYRQKTYLLLDECHRWSKAQSDSILPAVEQGVILFIGSTTENPAIAMTSAIVSRCRLFHFEPLTKEDIIVGLQRAMTDKERGFGEMALEAAPEALEHIASVANGDVRTALNALELAVLTTHPDEDGVVRITLAIAEDSIQQRVVNIDESQYFDMLSAFCKSLRGSDATAALAWMARLIKAGVDPRIIARRLIAHASEDVGLASPQAMVQAVAAAQALEFNGVPEALLSLTQAIIFVCECPKSNSVVVALNAAMDDVRDTVNDPVPVHLRNVQEPSAEKTGKAPEYLYPHDFPGHWVAQQYRPDAISDHVYYRPSAQGNEARIRENWIKRGWDPDE